MKPSDIKVGKTYCNRGAGHTTRKVLSLGVNVDSKQVWFGDPDKEPYEMVVTYIDNRGRTSRLYVSSFASWAGLEVGDD